MHEASVVFKGTVNCLTIILQEGDKFEPILEEIEKKVSCAGKFFKNAILDVKYKGKVLTKSQEQDIFDLLVAKSGAKIKGIQKEEKIEEVKKEVKKEETTKEHFKSKMKNFYFKNLKEGITKFYRGTVRSGHQLNFDGNVVVIGDVNPGGEVIATGNIVVMGALRGIVHAGSDGNKEAVVVALSLNPTQLRIADVITRSPDESDGNMQFLPEIAYIKNGSVYIESYLQQR